VNFPFFIAWRYLVSKKKQNIINIISGVAILGVTVGTLALVVVLSVFNGFDGLVRSMFNSFDPDLKIIPVQGKTFDPSKINMGLVERTTGIQYWAFVLEESAILKHGAAHDVVTVKGVSSNYEQVTKLDSLIYDGELSFEKAGLPQAVVGLGVALNVGIRLNSLEGIDLYAAKKGEQVSVNPMRALNHEYIIPSAIFNVQEAYDSQYILVPLNFARSLFDTPLNISAIEIKLTENANVDATQSQIKSIVGSGFHVKNKIQQQELVYKVMNSEKWAIYFILVFILIIASFNILGSLSMLIIDKKENIAIFKSMGAGQNLIRKFFLYEGWLISIVGSVLGVILGCLICLIQIRFHLLKFPGGGSFAVPAYPVEIHLTDVLLTMITVIIIGFIASWIPLRYISGKYLDFHHEK
jgi:lipoprotein-releasing system permease protein